MTSFTSADASTYAIRGSAARSVVLERGRSGHTAHRRVPLDRLCKRLRFRCIADDDEPFDSARRHACQQRNQLAVVRYLDGLAAADAAHRSREIVAKLADSHSMRHVTT
jgi:hypothetical protein